jgi:FtsP/CotA-like multicopper oxidase with cupredoxin domain
MGQLVRSKKMADSDLPGGTRTNWTYPAENGRINLMADRVFRLDRREFLTGLGVAALGAAQPDIAVAQGRLSPKLQAKAGSLALQSGQPETLIWSLQGSPPDLALRFRRGEQLETTLQNDLPVPAVLNWRGLDGVAAAEPLAARPPLATAANESLVIPWRHAGTFLCDLSLLGDGATRPSRGLPVIVAESEPVPIDRDEVFLIEGWRLRPDGAAIAPGVEPTDTTLIYTVNGLQTPDIAMRARERLRFRFINGCQRTVIAVKMDGYEVRVMAVDSQPAEPFPARNSAIVLAPGGRADAFIDVGATPGSTSLILLHDGKEARPIARLVVSKEPPLRDVALPAAPTLPSNGLPAQLDLRGAARFELALGGPQGDWVRPAEFAGSAAPAFAARAGRTVVLALTNRGVIPAVFHLHGHHFRLLDRLDDGWKPFWLDTLAIDAGQTQRIAFAAEHAGRWLIEAVAADWAAPRLVRWYNVA